VTDLIDSSDLLIQRLGAWPSFHDAEVRRLRLDADGTTLATDIFVFATDGTTDAAGYFRRLHPTIVTLEFSGIEALRIDDWNSQNVLAALAVSPSAGDLFDVDMQSVFGVSATFRCQAARVLQVIPVD
jgi:hypothetical protein